MSLYWDNEIEIELMQFKVHACNMNKMILPEFGLVCGLPTLAGTPISKRETGPMS